jgi:ABC-2 type transport system ATP-binding protein
MSNQLVVETSKLHKVYGNQAAVCNLDLSVSAGGITAFLGRNGAGKTTTIKMLMGLVRPTSGTAHVLGCPIDDPKNYAIRQKIAYVSEDKSLYPYMSVGQLVEFTRSFYCDWRSDIEARLMKQFQLRPQQKLKNLSKGARTKLALLLSLSRRPRLLILDEPSDGLDPVSIEEFLQELVLVAADETTIFFSSHQIADVERIADRVAIIDQGMLVSDMSLDDLRANYRRLTVGFANEPPSVDFAPPGTISMFRDGRQISLLAKGDVDSLIEYVQSFRPVNINVTPTSLREMFLETVGKENQ